MSNFEYQFTRHLDRQADAMEAMAKALTRLVELAEAEAKARPEMKAAVAARRYG